MKAEKKINKLDNIAVRSADITEAWQEGGTDFITVRVLASLLDYTVSESGELLAGSKTEPVKFEEYWTFARPVGSGNWQLSANNQPDCSVFNSPAGHVTFPLATRRSRPSASSPVQIRIF